MAFQNGQVPCVSGSATRIYEPTAAGFVVLQCIGNAAVAVGGPGVTFAQGLQLPLGASAGVGGLPQTFPVAHYGNLADAEDGIFGITSSGTVNVSFVAGS